MRQKKYGKNLSLIGGGKSHSRPEIGWDSALLVFLAYRLIVYRYTNNN